MFNDWSTVQIYFWTIRSTNEPERSGIDYCYITAVTICPVQRSQLNRTKHVRTELVQVVNEKDGYTAYKLKNWPIKERAMILLWMDYSCSWLSEIELKRCPRKVHDNQSPAFSVFHMADIKNTIVPAMNCWRSQAKWVQDAIPMPQAFILRHRKAQETPAHAWCHFRQKARDRPKSHGTLRGSAKSGTNWMPLFRIVVDI